MKKTTIIILSVVISLVVVGATSAVASLPTTISSEQKLQEEIRKIISAGHLRPAYFNETEYWAGKMHLEGTIHTGMFDYWSNPAETIYVLIRALPYLPDTPYPDDPGKSWQEKTKEYIQAEWNLCRPDVNTHCGWENGAPRETFDLPPEAYQEYTTVNNTNRKQPGVYTTWRKWATAPYTFHPFNFYAAWLYAKEFGGAGTILNTMKLKIKSFPTDEEMLRNNMHVVNSYIAGYYGFLGLYDLAGRPTTDSALVSQVQQIEGPNGWLATALAKRVELLDIPPHEVRGTDQGGFLYLVPELAQHLRQNALPKVQNQVQTYNSYSAPYWFAANIDEVQRLTDEYQELPSTDPTPTPPAPTPTRVSGGEEGATSTYYAYWSLFQAKAQILQESREELEKYLDVPAVERGDLYYIDNLVSTIEKGGETSIIQILSTYGKTGTADLNSDGKVNGVDIVNLF